MKISDIKEYETGEHCFGDILRVNGVDYDDLSIKDTMGIIHDVMENNINSSSYIKEIFKIALEYAQLDFISGHTDDCDQCGNWNSYSKYGIEDELET
jgi:hypothetical protein